MNKKIFIPIIILIIIIISIIIFVSLFSLDYNQQSNNVNTDSISDDIITNNQVSVIKVIDNQNIDLIPNRILYKLPKAKSESEDRGLIDYIYSKDLGIAVSYEGASINKDSYLIPKISNNLIYLYKLGQEPQSGQSIEIINIDTNFRFSTIPEIITQQILNADEKSNCKIEEKNGRYSIIAKDLKVKDSTKMCGNYAKGNNRFFMRPIEDGSSISKLIFVNAGSQELSYDGSGRGKYWYESVIVE